MSVLDYRCTGDNTLSFELLVDGQPLGAQVGAKSCSAIPYWIIRDDLPYWPPEGEEHDPEVRIVCVCSCGEYGCRHTRCRISPEGDEMVFRDFKCDVAPEHTQKEFHFAGANYQTVVGQIVDRAQKQAGSYK